MFHMCLNVLQCALGAKLSVRRDATHILVGGCFLSVVGGERGPTVDPHKHEF